MLRRKIALYRQYLSEGVESHVARSYLRQILEAESELAEIEEQTERRR